MQAMPCVGCCFCADGAAFVQMVVSWCRYHVWGMTNLHLPLLNTLRICAADAVVEVPMYKINLLYALVFVKLH